MSRRRNVARHLKSLGEIREIMNSMKTLAYVETQKLSRLLESQRAVVAAIEQVADDFLSFHPELLSERHEAACTYLLIGSERGFCGDLNPGLLRALDAAVRESREEAPLVIGVGRKLHVVLEDDARVAALIDGPGVAEEVVAVLHRIVAELMALQSARGARPLRGLYTGDDGSVVIEDLLPPFRRKNRPRRFPHPPMLNVEPAQFLLDLTDQYLFAALHEMLYVALMTENHRRVAHLEGAVRHLDDQAAALAHKHNALRQEEIIEEIEVILLNVPQPADGSKR